MKYKKGYKYITAESCAVKTVISLEKDICIPNYVYLQKDGLLVVMKNYAWDGASFFLARDNKRTLRASLTHDSLYQLMREGLLSKDFKDSADRLLQKILIENGITRFEAGAWYLAVKTFAGFAINNQVKIYEAV